jgi:homoserine dehydrogenase
MKEVRIALLGLGTVGAGVVKLLDSQRTTLEERAGGRLTLAAIADTDLTRAREGLDLRSLPMTADAQRVLGDPSVQVVIELIGGLEPARSFILKALASGKHVVTANKALLAHHGAELYEEARRRGVTLAFEAAVAGGIPLIRAVRDGLVANRILATSTALFSGIGTSSPGALFAVHGPALIHGTTTILGGLNTHSISATSSLGFYTASAAAPRGPAHGGRPADTRCPTASAPTHG